VGEIAAFCVRHPGSGFGCCYDTAHVRKTTAEVISEIRSHEQVIKVVHLSSRCDDAQHLRASDPKGKLDGASVVRDLAQRGFRGPVVLEYLPALHRWLVPDALALQRIVAQTREE
jgi:sugar phosphate isomerase/epimerase